MLCPRGSLQSEHSQKCTGRQENVLCVLAGYYYVYSIDVKSRYRI